MVKKSTLVVLAVVVIIVAVGLAYAFLPGYVGKGAPKEVKIGAVGTFTGAEAWISQTCRNLAEMAVEDINAAGGIGGKPVKLLFEDDKGEPSIAVSASRKLIGEEIIGGLFMSGSEVGLPVAEVWGEYKVPLLVTFAGHPNITKPDNVFRTAPLATVSGQALAYYVVKTYGAKTAAIVVTDDPYEVAVYDSGFKQEFEKLGGKIVYEKMVEWGEKSYEAILTKIKPLNPDVIVMPGDYTMSIPFTTQARGMGINVPLVAHVSTASIEYWKGIKGLKNLGDIISFSYVNIDDPKVQAVMTKYKEKYGELPSPVAFYSYPAVYVLKEAIESVGMNPDAIVNYLKTQEIKTPTGPIKFTERGELNIPIPIVKVDEEGLHVVALIPLARL